MERSSTLSTTIFQLKSIDLVGKVLVARDNILFTTTD